jgi:hypothetical protein
MNGRIKIILEHMFRASARMKLQKNLEKSSAEV